MVAPSFQSMTQVSEIYIKNGKNYVNVKNEKTGTIRSVRWYSEKEYYKIYGKSTVKSIFLQSDRLKNVWPAAVRSLEISGTNPKIMQMSYCGDPKIAKVKIWQAYMVKMYENKKMLKSL